ncbi:MAG: PKD domain-containing protein, partial [Euryarchaeota archaeon]|nr:PKD domain-containing protein [Euryarchaeota archaeon]
MQSTPLSEPTASHARWRGRTLPILLAGVAVLLLSLGGLPGSSSTLWTPSVVATPHHLGAVACERMGSELGGGCAGAPSPSGGTSRFPTSVSVVNWTQVCASCGLSARRDAAMAWDPADNYVLLFGGCSGNPCSGATGDTWKYVGGSWYQVNANGSVPARFGAALVYDAKDGYMLLFGGCDHNPCYQLMYQDTWTYKAGTWTQLSPATSPPVRGAPGMAYDPVDQYAVLFGGWGGSSFLGDTWTFAGGAWTQATPSTAPTARDDIGFTWDAKDGYVLLYGGDSNAVQGETWSFLGGQWTELFPAAGPGERSLENDMMTYFSTDQFVVLMGGTVTGPTCENDTWAWVNQNWLLLHPHSAPSPRGMSILADDPPGGDVIDLGGWTCSTVVGDTWRFNGTIPLTATAAGTPSPTDVAITVAFTSTVSGGKTPYSFAWRYGDGGVGGGATPSHVFNASGTFNVRCWVNDSGGQKVALTVPMVVNPWPTATVGAAPNPSDVGVRVAFTTVTGGGTSPFNETWRFGDGSVGWTTSVAHTYAAPGTYLVRLWANDSAGGSASPMTNVSVNAVPLLSARATPTITDVGMPLAFSASATGGTGSLSYAWAFGDGGRSPTPNLSHNYSAPGAYAPKVWANDSIGGTSNASIPLHIDPLPSAPSIIVLPTPADAGQTLNLSANSTGGTGRIVYTWRLGDGNVGVGSQISHVYSSAGSFTVHVWANDSVGGSTLGVVVVAVAPRPWVTSFVSTPSAT